MSYGATVNGYPEYTGVPTTPIYPERYQVSSYEPLSIIQTLFSYLAQEGEKIKLEGQNYNRTLTDITQKLNALPKIEETKPIEKKQEIKSVYTPVLSGFYSVAKRVKDYIFGDGLKLLGGMAAALSVAFIMRKYQNTFALPTLAGNYGTASSYRYHQW